MFVLPADLSNTCTREIRCLWKCRNRFKIAVLPPYCRCQLCSSLNIYSWKSFLSEPLIPKVPPMPVRLHTSCAILLLQNLHSDAPSLTVVSWDIMHLCMSFLVASLIFRQSKQHAFGDNGFAKSLHKVPHWLPNNFLTNSKQTKQIYMLICTYSKHCNKANYTESHVLSFHVRYPNVWLVC